jgi:hypothetical protein
LPAYALPIKTGPPAACDAHYYGRGSFVRTMHMHKQSSSSRAAMQQQHECRSPEDGGGALCAACTRDPGARCAPFYVLYQRERRAAREMQLRARYGSITAATTIAILGLLLLLARMNRSQAPQYLTLSLPQLFWGVPDGCVWGCKECESTKSHAVKVVCLCEKSISLHTNHSSNSIFCPLTHCL